jgi:hypothetical protein
VASAQVATAALYRNGRAETTRSALLRRLRAVLRGLRPNQQVKRPVRRGRRSGPGRGPRFGAPRRRAAGGASARPSAELTQL